MTSLLRRWGDDPSLSCPDPREWPDLEDVMPRTGTPRPVMISVRARPPPLLTTPYESLLGLPKQPRRRSKDQTKGRGKGKGPDYPSGGGCGNGGGSFYHHLNGSY